MEMHFSFLKPACYNLKFCGTASGRVEIAFGDCWLSPHAYDLKRTHEKLCNLQVVLNYFMICSVALFALASSLGNPLGPEIFQRLTNITQGPSKRRSGGGGNLRVVDWKAEKRVEVADAVHRDAPGNPADTPVLSGEQGSLAQVAVLFIWPRARSEASRRAKIWSARSRLYQSQILQQKVVLVSMFS